MHTDSEQREFDLALAELAAKARDRFEGKECIYVERGVVRVRVSNIRVQGGLRATVEIIPTPELGVGALSAENPNLKPRWEICGHSFTDRVWVMGYGGWRMYFDPSTIEAVMKMATEFPLEMENMERSLEILKFLVGQSSGFEGPWHRLPSKFDPPRRVTPTTPAPTLNPTHKWLRRFIIVTLIGGGFVGTASALEVFARVNAALTVRIICGMTILLCLWATCTGVRLAKNPRRIASRK